MMNKAFTLIEVVLALFLFTVAMAGIFALVLQITTYTSFSFSQLTAAYLGQEGIEITRNIRDSNWLNQREDLDHAWNSGLTCGVCEGDFQSGFLTALQGEGRFLNFQQGFYSYANGAPTKFKRKININNSQPDILEVRVEVFWEEKGKQRSFSAQENLYNWYGIVQQEE